MCKWFLTNACIRFFFNNYLNKIKKTAAKQRVILKYTVLVLSHVAVERSPAKRRLSCCDSCLNYWSRSVVSLKMVLRWTENKINSSCGGWGFSDCSPKHVNVSSCLQPPRWPSGKASTSRVEGPGFESRLRQDFFVVESYTSDLNIGTPVATLPGVIGSALGLVGPVSVYCDWVRWKVWSATSISVWQHVKLCRSVPEIHSHVAGTLSNQQTNKLLSSFSPFSSSFFFLFFFCFLLFFFFFFFFLLLFLHSLHHFLLLLLFLLLFSLLSSSLSLLPLSRLLFL